MAELRFHGRPVAAVTFDLWETLITDNVETIRIRDALRCTRVSQALALEGWGMDVPVVRVTQAVAEVDARCLAIRSKSGDVTITQQVGFLLDALQVAEDARGSGAAMRSLEEAYTSPVFDHLPAPMPGAVEVLQRLNDAGVSIGLISNTGRTPGRTLRPLLDSFGLTGYFDVLTFSDEHGMCKPAAALFERTLLALNVTPDRAVHIGDQQVLDVLGPHLAGMGAVLLARHGVPDNFTHEPDGTVTSLAEFAAQLGLDDLSGAIRSDAEGQ